MARGAAILSLALVLGLLGAATDAEEAAPAWEPARTWALLIGVLEWESPSLSPFPKPGRVDRALEAALLARGVPRAQLRFLEDREATVAACLGELERIAGEAGAGSTLILYFAGHGGLEGDISTWLPFDYDPADDAATALSAATVARVLREGWKGERLLLWADCCHSGGIASIVDGYAASTTVRAAALPSSLACNESTGEWTFTESLVAALRGDPAADLDADGAVTLEETEAYVRREMRHRAAQLTEARRSASFEPGFVLARVPPEQRRARAPGPWQLGDYAEAFWKERWWRARILETGEAKARVRYLGYDAAWDEWKAHDQLRAPQPIESRAMERVEILWKGRWWPGVVREVREDWALVHYDGYGAAWDEWVTHKRLRPPSK